ncbi:hypothetical protein [Streptomyces litchfieldiae]|uniref:Lipoprotein n=1 Tax=Streptomyces litchfieldiae TaxID=3075543 RepID=A0ABU2MJQ7_9ACTN|nr:hypothetical protein [Streptomyces sp. DSM 44938]MDT0341838.1 hypothetical protein [Streptomyces sp. DSM 44938]
MTLLRGIPGALLAALAVLLLAGCGEEAADDAAAPPSEAPASEAPTGEGAGDEVSGGESEFGERYSENHAFRDTLDLDPAEQRRGEEEAERARQALETLRTGGEFGPEEVNGALTGLGYQADAVFTAAFGDQVTFAVSLSPVCLEGIVGPAAVTVEAHGVYMEGGCREPAGGH